MSKLTQVEYEPTVRPLIGSGKLPKLVVAVPVNMDTYFIDRSIRLPNPLVTPILPPGWDERRWTFIWAKARVELPQGVTLSQPVDIEATRQYFFVPGYGGVYPTDQQIVVTCF